MRPALAVAAAAALAYLPSFWGVYQFDDYNVVFRDGWTELRPLLRASYVITSSHLLNIAFHATNAALSYLVGEKLFGDRRAAFIAALLFALHPAATEAVTYISGRSVSMMAVFYLGAMLAYLRGAHWSISSLLFLLALATKETAVTLPAALLLCELCRNEKFSLKTILQRQWPHWTLLVAFGVFVLFNQRYFDLVAHGYGERSLADNLLTQVGGVSYLVLRLVSLHGYNIDPALPALTEWTPPLAFQAFSFLLLLMLGIMNLRARPWIAFGVLWFFVQLAPTNSIVPRLDVANDRQLYLASWGLFLALCMQLRNLPRFAAGAVILLFAATSVARQMDYWSEISLWESSVSLAPWNARGHNNLGYAYQLAGRGEEARREYRAALLFDPRHAKARLNLMLLPPGNVKKP
jgi:hypothetical protein